MLPKSRPTLALFLSSFLVATPALAEPKVVTSIKPVHSLVASVMKGVGNPELLIEGAQSPHSFSLKPSQAEAIQNADLVFWIGREIETFLEKPLETIGADAESVDFLSVEEIAKLPYREEAVFEDDHHDDHDDHAHDDHDKDEHKHEEHAHDDHKHDEKAHDDHDHDKHEDEHAHKDDHAHGDEHKHDDDHKHDAEHKHDDHAHDDDHKDEKEHAHKDDHDDHKHEEEHAHHDEKEHDDHGHDHHGHEHGEFDGHIWLDPENAKAMVKVIAAKLVAADADNAARYEANAAELTAKLDILIEETEAALKPVKDKRYVVFHDAYQYFEKRFGLKPAAAITLPSQTSPSVQRINEVREKLVDSKASCVFSEPQFDAKLVATVAEGTDAKASVIDPLGANLTPAPDLYEQLIREMAGSLVGCLSDKS